MTFPHINRRTHLYLGLALLPWFTMYGISSWFFSHGDYFEERDKATGLPSWNLRYEKPYDVAPPDGNELRPWATRVLADTGLHGTSYGAYRQGPNQVNVYVYTIWNSTQVKYFNDKKLMRVEDKRFRWDHAFTGLHGMGGFDQDGFLRNAWSVIVDIVCVGIVIWIVSGLYMWWHVPGHRAWGWVAVLGGWISFVLFLWKL